MPLGEMTKLIYRYPTFYGFDYQQTGVMVIRGENIGRDGSLTPSNAPCFISTEINARFPRTILEEGDLVMSVRGEVGKTALITSEYTGCNINANTIRISLKPSLRGNPIRPDFVWAILNSRLGKAQLRRFIAGGVQETITAPEILEVVVPFMDVQDQQNFVTALQRSMKSRDAKLTQAEILLNGIDDLLLAELGLPKPTTDVRLVYAVRLATMKARLNAEYYHPERVLAVRAMEKARGRLKAARLAEIADFKRDVVKVSENDRYLGLASIEPNTGELTGQDETATGLAFTFQKDDVLFSRLRPYLNKVRQAEEPGICSTEFHVIRIKEGLPYAVLPEYLACVLRSSPILAQTRRMMTGNTHPRLANEDVVDLVVPIPDEAAQKRLADEVAGRKEQVRRVRAEAAALWAKALEDFERKLLAKGAKA